MMTFIGKRKFVKKLNELRKCYHQFDRDLIGFTMIQSSI